MLSEVKRRPDSHSFQLDRQLTSYAPDFFHWKAFQNVDSLRFVQQQTGFYAIHFRLAVGDFCQRPSRGDSNGNRNARPELDAVNDRLSKLRCNVSHSRQVQKRFVDRILFNFRNRRRQGLHDPLAHVAVQSVVRRKDGNAIGAAEFPNLEKRRAHGNSKLFRFPTSGDNAAVVVRQDNNRASAQKRLERRLARCVKTVTVSQSKEHGGCMGTEVDLS